MFAVSMRERPVSPRAVAPSWPTLDVRLFISLQMHLSRLDRLAPVGAEDELVEACERGEEALLLPRGDADEQRVEHVVDLTRPAALDLRLHPRGRLDALPAPVARVGGAQEHPAQLERGDDLGDAALRDAELRGELRHREP